MQFNTPTKALNTSLSILTTLIALSTPFGFALLLYKSQKILKQKQAQNRFHTLFIKVKTSSIFPLLVLFRFYWTEASVLFPSRWSNPTHRNSAKFIRHKQLRSIIIHNSCLTIF